MIYNYGCRIDKDSNAITVIDEENIPVETNGYVNGEAVVTLTTGSGEEYLMLIPVVSTEINDCEAVYQFSGSAENELIVPLYKGKALVLIDGPYTVTVTGDAEFDEQEYTVTITGDCTITLS